MRREQGLQKVTMREHRSCAISTILFFNTEPTEKHRVTKKRISHSLSVGSVLNFFGEIYEFLDYFRLEPMGMGFLLACIAKLRKQS